jgi:hypothetical protein
MRDRRRRSRGDVENVLGNADEVEGVVGRAALERELAHSGNHGEAGEGPVPQEVDRVAESEVRDLAPEVLRLGEIERAAAGESDILGADPRFASDRRVEFQNRRNRSHSSYLGRW